MANALTQAAPGWLPTLRARSHRERSILLGPSPAQHRDRLAVVAGLKRADEIFSCPAQNERTRVHRQSRPDATQAGFQVLPLDDGAHCEQHRLAETLRCQKLEAGQPDRFRDQEGMVPRKMDIHFGDNAETFLQRLAYPPSSGSPWKSRYSPLTDVWQPLIRPGKAQYRVAINPRHGLSGLTCQRTSSVDRLGKIDGADPDTDTDSDSSLWQCPQCATRLSGEILTCPFGWQSSPFYRPDGTEPHPAQGRLAHRESHLDHQEHDGERRNSEGAVDACRRVHPQTRPRGAFRGPVNA
ncbi:hypothetical protein SAMN05421854_102653 [Amycolatopsis rubida]|uniref:Uncharacterized protein n=1 Tax=Amycolatopsis rubida TaxID=112413 RepID=A0A1I5ISD0_9PSEU|nr:hypothetical protein SAMN05421854_102653 [Amycolatopsis rubida]